MTQGLDLVPPGELLVHADLAEQALEGLVRAPHYAELDIAHVVVPVADVQAADGACAGQILFGEVFEILFRRGGRSYGRARRDGVVGWLADDVLKSGAPLAAYRVTALDAALPFNALIRGDEGLNEGQVTGVGEFDVDPVEVALRFLEVPYKVGARASHAVDGLGLVQQALFACGLAAPRSAAELAEQGHRISASEARRGDLVVWVKAGAPYAGHAALMVDAQHMVHASALEGKVVVEQLADVAAGLSIEAFEAPVVLRL